MRLLSRLSLALLLVMGGGEIMQVMVDVYVALIIAGRRTIEQVPEQLRPAVALELEALGITQ